LEQVGVGTIVGTISGRDRAVYRCFFLVSREINVRHVSVEIFIRSFFLSFNRYFPLVAILAVTIYRFLLLSRYAEKLAKSLSQMFVVLLMRIMPREIKLWQSFANTWINIGKFYSRDCISWNRQYSPRYLKLDKIGVAFFW